MNIFLENLHGILLVSMLAIGVIYVLTSSLGKNLFSRDWGDVKFHKISRKEYRKQGQVIANKMLVLTFFVIAPYLFIGEYITNKFANNLPVYISAQLLLFGFFLFLYLKGMLWINKPIREARLFHDVIHNEKKAPFYKRKLNILELIILLTIGFFGMIFLVAFLGTKLST